MKRANKTKVKHASNREILGQYANQPIVIQPIMNQPIMNQPFVSQIAPGAIRMRNTRSVRNQQANLFGRAFPGRMNRNINHLESGLRSATDNLAELSEAVHDTRAMVVSSLAGLSNLSNQVNRGFNANQRISERILHVSTEMRNVLRESRRELGMNPWKILFIYWKGLLHITVLLWQLSFDITRNVLAVMPCPLFLCSCGCMILECATLIFITDCSLCMGSFNLSRHFGLSYQLFRMLVNFALVIVPSICGRMINAAMTYYRPYVQIVSEVSGISLDSIQNWRDNVSSSLRDFVSSSVRTEVDAAVEPIVDELKNMPGMVYNATSSMVTDAASAIVYDAPKAVVNRVFGVGTGSTLANAAGTVVEAGTSVGSAALRRTVDAGSLVADYGSAAARRTVDAGSLVADYGSAAARRTADAGSLLGRIGSNVGSAALKKSVNVGSAALGLGLAVGSTAIDGARGWLHKKMSGGGDNPFAHINLLEGTELDEFNRTIGKHLVKLHKMLDKAFILKYGEDTVLDDNAQELVVFMEKAFDLALDQLAPSMANMIDQSRIIPVDHGLRKVLIESAFNVSHVKVKSRRRRIRGRKTRRR